MARLAPKTHPFPYVLIRQIWSFYVKGCRHGISRKEPLKLGSTGARLGIRVVPDPLQTCHSTCRIWSLLVRRYVWRSAVPRVLIFKVTPGHRNWHRAIGYDFLIVLTFHGNYGPVLYRFQASKQASLFAENNIMTILQNINNTMAGYQKEILPSSWSPIVKYSVIILTVRRKKR